MLRSALRSIQDQSRQDLIAEVVVSENSEDGPSDEVCREFPDLPIRFVRHDPVKTIAAHFQWLVDQAASEWVAWLADDDMWGRYHLEEAARLLRQHPEAVAYTGECVTVLNDSRTAIFGLRETVYSLLGDTPVKHKPCWVWTREDMLLNTLLHTPLNMWAMVFRKETLVKCVECLVPSNVGYESDRLFLWKVSLEGPVVVGREISLFYRTHDTNNYLEQWREDQAKQQRMTRLYINTIIDEAEKLGIPAKALWLRAWQSLDTAAKRRILKKNDKFSIDEIRQRWGDEAMAVEPDARQPKPGRASVLKPLVPPVLWDVAAKLLKGNGKQA